MSDTVANDVFIIQHEVCSCPKHVNLLTMSSRSHAVLSECMVSIGTHAQQPVTARQETLNQAECLALGMRPSYLPHTECLDDRSVQHPRSTCKRLQSVYLTTSLVNQRFPRLLFLTEPLI